MRCRESRRRQAAAVIFFCAFLAAFPAAANEHAEPAEGAAVSPAYSGKQSQEWEKIQNQLGALKTKVDAQETVVQGLIEQKSALRGQALTDKVEELKTQYAKLRKLTDDYNELHEEYLTRFPERGLKEPRVYTRARAKSLQSYEDDQSLSGRVRSVHRKILKQYPKSRAEADAEKAKRPAAPAGAPEGEGHTSAHLPPGEKPSGRPASADVTDAILFKK